MPCRSETGDGKAGPVRIPIRWVESNHGERPNLRVGSWRQGFFLTHPAPQGVSIRSPGSWRRSLCPADPIESGFNVLNAKSRWPNESRQPGPASVEKAVGGQEGGAIENRQPTQARAESGGMLDVSGTLTGCLLFAGL